MSPPTYPAFDPALAFVAAARSRSAFC